MRIPRSIEDKYDILLPLGEGGMDAVFKVRHRLLNGARVIKVIRPGVADDGSLKARFLREAQAAAEFRHPNVAQVYDFAIEPDGTPYIVMEFIAGLTWRHLIDRHGGLPIPLAVEMASQCLGALEYLHQRSFVHRDIAPDNIMLSRDVEGRLQVKLIDLGLAKRLTGDVGLTATGWFVGKLRYASPEQFHTTDGELDPRSDLYSLGVVLFELLTGALSHRRKAWVTSRNMYQTALEWTRSQVVRRTMTLARTTVAEEDSTMTGISPPTTPTGRSE